MAEATVGVEEVMVPRDVTTVTLKLTEAEALVVAALVGGITGHPGDTVRGITNDIYATLRKAGYNGVSVSDLFSHGTFSGLHAKDDSRVTLARALGIITDA